MINLHAHVHCVLYGCLGFHSLTFGLSVCVWWLVCLCVMLCTNDYLISLSLSLPPSLPLCLSLSLSLSSSHLTDLDCMTFLCSDVHFVHVPYPHAHTLFSPYTCADPPIPPLGLNLVLMAGNPAPTLWLVWERPFNVDPQVDISYTVEINSTRADGMHYGPFQNINQTSLPIDFLEALHSNRSCQMYEFFVSAINGAGSSVPSRYLETLPISKYTIILCSR